MALFYLKKKNCNLRLPRLNYFQMILHKNFKLSFKFNIPISLISNQHGPTWMIGMPIWLNSAWFVDAIWKEHECLFEKFNSNRIGLLKWGKMIMPKFIVVSNCKNYVIFWEYRCIGRRI